MGFHTPLCQLSTPMFSHSIIPIPFHLAIFEKKFAILQVSGQFKSVKFLRLSPPRYFAVFERRSMELGELSSTADAGLKPSGWYRFFGVSKHAEARDADGFITAPEASDVASLSLHGAIRRSYPNDTARWLAVASKLDALLAELHGDPEMRMHHAWLPDSRFNRIARANDHPEFTREHAIWLLTTIEE